MFHVQYRRVGCLAVFVCFVCAREFSYAARRGAVVSFLSLKKVVCYYSGSTVGARPSSEVVVWSIAGVADVRIEYFVGS